MMAFLPISSIPMIERRASPKIVSSHRPLHRGREPPSTITREGFCSSGSGPITRDAGFPRARGSYNAALATRPFTTKAAGTGITYFFSDLTAQALEGDRVH